MTVETNLKQDVATFNDIFDALLQDEIDHPVTEAVKPEVLLKQLGIGLRDEPMPDDAFNRHLKHRAIVFIISSLTVEKGLLFWVICLRLC